MTTEQKNKDLCEKVMGKCWHFSIEYPIKTSCSVCGIPMPFFNPDYFHNWNDYGGLVKVLLNHERWLSFGTHLHSKWWTGGDHRRNWMKVLLDPEKGSDAIWEFFCGGGR